MTQLLAYPPEGSRRAVPIGSEVVNGPHLPTVSLNKVRARSGCQAA